MNHLPQLMIDLALILCSAGIASIVFKKLKQPVVLGYILVGFFVGPSFHIFPTVSDTESIKIWAELGVIFLLFSLGLEFSFKKLLKLGSSVVITGLFEITAMLFTGYFLGKFLGWSQIDSLFLGGILAISSTTIIFRSFDELNLKHKKFATTVIGILVIEDVMAVLLMVLLTTVSVSQQVKGDALAFEVIKLLFFLVLWFLAGIFLLPSLFKKASKWMNDETMLIMTMGLCFGMVLIAAGVGFSPALGAFIMGSLLAETVQAERIEHLHKPVKDLFGGVFFVSVGMLIQPTLLWEQSLPVFLITLAVLFGKTIFVSVGSLLSGQPLKQSIQTGTSMSQIGEFSFIIAGLGVTLSVTSDTLYPIAVGVSVITTFLTPYMIQIAEPMYHSLVKWLPEKTLQSLNRYSTGAQRIHTENHWGNVIQSYLQIVIINTVITFAIVLAFKQVVEPMEWFPNGKLSSIVLTVLALLCMAPFLWMLTTRKLSKASYAALWVNRYNRGPIIVLEVIRVALGVLLVSFLLQQFFALWIALTISAILMLVTGIVFSRKLHQFSVRIEDRFKSNYNLRESLQIQNRVSGLLPWDAHLAVFDIDVDSILISKSLAELALRETYGINIVVIERGNKSIMLPDKHQRIFPFDRISVIGTDEQVLKFKQAIEVKSNHALSLPEEADLTLTQITVKPGFPYLGKSIRVSGIREKAQAMIVGIERNGERILNPDSSIEFMLHDTCWIVGDKQKIKAHFKT